MCVEAIERGAEHAVRGWCSDLLTLSQINADAVATQPEAVAIGERGPPPP